MAYRVGPRKQRNEALGSHSLLHHLWIEPKVQKLFSADHSMLLAGQGEKQLG